MSVLVKSVLLGTVGPLSLAWKEIFECLVLVTEPSGKPRVSLCGFVWDPGLSAALKPASLIREVMHEKYDWEENFRV